MCNYDTIKYIFLTNKMPIQPSALSAPPRILLSQSTSPRLVCGMRRASPPPLPGARERLDAGTTRREHPTTLRDVVPAESHDVRGPRAALGDVTLRRRRGRERFIAGEKSTRRSCRACRRAGSRRSSSRTPRVGRGVVSAATRRRQGVDDASTNRARTRAVACFWRQALALS